MDQEERRSFIGGSDARIIMGNDEARLVRLWREKRGEVEPEDFSKNLVVQLGRCTEQLNRHWFEHSTNQQVTDVQRRARHPVHRWMAATLDGVVQPSGAVFEAKFMLPWAFSQEAAIEKHMAQLQHNMWVVHARSAALSIITGGGQWIEATVHADPLYQHLLLTAERKFWRCVQAGETPRLFGVEAPRARLAPVRIVDMSSSNSWAEYAGVFRQTREPHERHEAAKADLKKLVPEDAERPSGTGCGQSGPNPARLASSWWRAPVHSSSPTIGVIAAALAKAQLELTNPEKTLAGTIQTQQGERSFRYASLACGLALVRKSLGEHEIAVMQSTAVDRGQILLTTLLAHASGEWVSSLWPVCSIAETSSRVKGAALTYARRYALFALVGIAGEDDLDAPDLDAPTEWVNHPGPAIRGKNGKSRVSPPPLLAQDQSALLRDKLVKEISNTVGEDNLALWALRSLPLKNTLSQEDAKVVEAAYLEKVSGSSDRLPAAGEQKADLGNDGKGRINSEEPQDEPTSAFPALTKQIRKRSKAHLAFVASQPCIVCQRTPCDAHHLKIAQPQSLGRKVSDEFTVPLCRTHHDELHRHGNESNWWKNLQIAPIEAAEELWKKTKSCTARATA